MITSEQKELVRATFYDVAELPDPFMKLFYGRLFQQAPETRPMFRQDIAVQGRKLMDMLELLVNGLDHLDTLEPTLRALGQRHAAYGVHEKHYRVVTDALMWSLGVALSDRLPAASKLAWQSILELVSAIMIEGARELSAEPRVAEHR